MRGSAISDIYYTAYDQEASDAVRFTLPSIPELLLHAPFSKMVDAPSDVQLLPVDVEREVSSFIQRWPKISAPKQVYVARSHVNPQRF
jgi:hypothetical protein